MTMQETMPERLLADEPRLAVRLNAPLVGAFVTEKAIPYISPRDRAIGRIEHLFSVIEGKEPKFSVYFVLDLDDHLKMHNHFLAELGLDPTNPLELSKQPEPTLIHVATEKGAVDLIRTANCYDEGQAFDVSYRTFEAEELTS